MNLRSGSVNLLGHIHSVSVYVYFVLLIEYNYRFHNVEFRVARTVAELEQSSSLFNHLPGFLWGGLTHDFPCIYCELHHPGFPDTLWAIGNLIQLQMVNPSYLHVAEVLVNGFFI